MSLGLPDINITFKENATTFVQRSKKGTIAMILKGEHEEETEFKYEITQESDIPQDLSEENREYIKRTLIGGEEKIKKILLYVAASGLTEITAHLGYFENKKFDYLVLMPDATATQTQELIKWIIKERSNGHNVKAVVTGNNADNKAIINFYAEQIKVGEDEFLTAQQFVSRMAGLIVGTPLTQSVTYLEVPEVISVKSMTRSELDTNIDEGRLVLFNDGEKTKIARGVTSQVNENAIQAFRKIKLVETCDMIENDIRQVFEDEYIGKITNSYDNKCLLLSAIKNYLLGLEKEGILESGKSEVAIDVDAQAKYIKETLEIDTSEMTEQEIKEYNTSDKVFIKITIKLLDAIENISVSIVM